jgi:glycosyltransferase involved in cell wall biosynthesis
MIRFSVVIPTYNEERSIAHAVRVTWQTLRSMTGAAEIIVVNDGSRDHTLAIVERLMEELPPDALRCLSFVTNRGKGAAVKAGVLNARGEQVGFLDADLATHPRELVTGFALLAEADAVIGSRRVPRAKFVKAQAWYRSWAGQWFNVLVRAATGLSYRDTQCGCKVFRAEVARDMFTHLQTTGWAFDVEILVRARQRGYRVREFPVDWINGPTSRVRLSAAPDIIQDIWRISRHGP